jgi:uncharacterized membrane protein HdeD (DUF308 family)
MALREQLKAGLADTLSRSWWMLLLRGLVAIAFGVLTFARPGITLASLVLVFGAFALADGVLGVWTALTHRHDGENRWLLLLGGLAGIGVGVLTLFEPGITAVALLFYIAIWAITTGVLEIVAAIRLRHEMQGEWMLVLAGLCSVAFGVLLMARPGDGALAVLWLIGSYALLFGLLLLALSFRVRGFAKALAPHPA